MAAFSDNFDRADSATPGGAWNNMSGLGSPGIPDFQILGNKAQSNNGTAASRNTDYATHGITVSGNMQMDYDMFAALNVNAGGVGVYLVDGSFNGYMVFVGNAVHIYKMTAGAATQLTNSSRPGDSGGGALANHVTFTRTSAGVMHVFLDGADWSTATDTTFSPGGTCIMEMYDDDAAAPTREAYVDNFVLQDFIGNPVIRPSGLIVPVGAISRAARW